MISVSLPKCDKLVTQTKKYVKTSWKKYSKSSCINKLNVICSDNYNPDCDININANKLIKYLNETVSSLTEDISVKDNIDTKWFNSHLKGLKVIRNKSYEQYNQNKSEINWEVYKKNRNYYKIECRKKNQTLLKLKSKQINTILSYCGEQLRIYIKPKIMTLKM